MTAMLTDREKLDALWALALELYDLKMSTAVYNCIVAELRVRHLLEKRKQC